MSKEISRTLDVIVDEPGALDDLPKLVKRLDRPLLEIHEEENQFYFFIRKSK